MNWVMLKEIISDLYRQINPLSWSHFCLHASRFGALVFLLLLCLIHPPLRSTQVSPGIVGIGVGLGVVKSDSRDDGTGKERQFND